MVEVNRVNSVLLPEQGGSSGGTVDFSQRYSPIEQIERGRGALFCVEYPFGPKFWPEYVFDSQKTEIETDVDAIDQRVAKALVSIF